MGKFTIGYQILFAVILGIITGLFFGPFTSILSPIGAAYTMLLQMAVLPYITFSLIHGLGSITPAIGKKIFKSGWPYFLFLWAFIFYLIYLLATLNPVTLPAIIKSESYTQVQDEVVKNFLSYLIPENPFYDIINNIVPAVAIFGLITGIALMHVENKEPLVGTLERINQTIEKILNWLGQLSPIGAYAYISVAFGTIYFEDLFKMQVYVIAVIASSIGVVFWLLPTLISSLTQMSYREALRTLRYLCIVPFATGISSAAIPFINNYLKKLSHKHATHEGFRETSQTILPIAYSFGHIGNAMILFFIFFLSYYYRHPFSIFEKSLLTLFTIPLSLGSSTGNLNSILFLIKQLGFEESAKTLFLEIKSFTNNFQVLMSIGSVVTLLLLTIYSYYGLIQVKWRQLILRIGVPLTILTIVILSVQALIHPRDLYQDLYMNLDIKGAVPDPVASKIFPPGETGVSRTYPESNNPQVLANVLETKILKVGFFPMAIPYCYFNTNKELVGLDIAYAYALARDLNCELQFIPSSFNKIGENLDNGIFDIAMSSIIMNEKRLVEMEFTTPYMEEDNVLIVPRAQKNSFLNLNNVLKISGLKIGASGVQVDIAKDNFPQATVTDINDTRPLVEGQIDAILWSRSSATIWCLSNPKFVVIDYGDDLGKSYFSYPVRKHALDFALFLNNWLNLKEQSGFKQDMINYWIHGMPLVERPPRWSILRNVLHFGK